MSDNGPSWPSEDDGSSTPPPPPPSGGGQQPSSGRSPAPSGGRQGASLGVRFGARIIDGIIVGIAAAVVGLVLGYGSSPGGGATYLATLVGVLIALAYYVGLEVTQGATLGKKMLGLQVHGAGGGHPTPEESLKRNCWYAFSIVPLVGQLAQAGAAVAAGITISSSADNRGWHDRFGDTLVTRG